MCRCYRLRLFGDDDLVAASSAHVGTSTKGIHYNPTRKDYKFGKRFHEKSCFHFVNLWSTSVELFHTLLMKTVSQEPRIAAESWGFGKHGKKLILHKKDSDGKF